MGLPFFVERSKKASFSYIKQYEKKKKKKLIAFCILFYFGKKKLRKKLIYFYVLHELHVFISKYNYIFIGDGLMINIKKELIWFSFFKINGERGSKFGFFQAVP